MGADRFLTLHQLDGGDPASSSPLAARPDPPPRCGPSGVSKFRRQSRQRTRRGRSDRSTSQVYGSIQVPSKVPVRRLRGRSGPRPSLGRRSAGRAAGPVCRPPPPTSRHSSAASGRRWSGRDPARRHAEARLWWPRPRYPSSPGRFVFTALEAARRNGELEDSRRVGPARVLPEPVHVPRNYP